MSDVAYNEKVKEVSVGNGYLYIELLSGLRLEAPLAPRPQPAGAADTASVAAAAPVPLH